MSSQMSGALPKKVDASQRGEQAMVSTRVDLVRIFPFMGFLVMSTEYYFTKDLPTMAATTYGSGGAKVYVNEEFMLSMSREERAFVVAHEILHIFLEHLGRAFEHNYHPQLWNVATDFCINSYLKEMNTNKIKMPSMGLYEDRFKGKGADEIYHILMKENGNDPNKACEQYGGGMPSDQEGDGNGDGDQDQDGNGKEGKNKGKGQRPFDDLQRTPMSDATKTENRQRIAASLGQSDIEAAKQMGSGYADLIRAFEDLIDSKIPWQDLLAEYITQQSKNRYTYDRLSRKSYGSRVMFPTMTGDNINLVFGVDTSGSMSVDDLNEAISELHAICEGFDNWHLSLVSCDTHAEVMGEYDSEEGDDFTTINKDMIGGGGTDMSPIVEYANDMEEPPSVVVIVTDGFIPEIDTVDEIPVFVIVTSSGNDELELDNCMVASMKHGRETA